MKRIFLLCFYLAIHSNEAQQDEIIAIYYIEELERYVTFQDVAILSFEIPEATASAAVLINTSATDCYSQNISVYMKHKSVPNVNPDNAKMSPNFKNITRAKQESIPLMAGDTMKRYDMPSPEHGRYFMVLYMPRDEGKAEKIAPREFLRDCKVFANVTVLANIIGNITQVVENFTYDEELRVDNLYRFFVPESVAHATIFFEKISLAADKLVVRVNSQALPSDKKQIANKTVGRSDKSSNFSFKTEENRWYYIELKLLGGKSSSLSFIMRYFYDSFPGNETSVFNSYQISHAMPYTLHRLVLRITGPFTGDYRLRHKLNVSEDKISLKSDKFVILKFEVKSPDLGGVLKVASAYKAAKGTKIAVCVRPGAPELPSWPKFCSSSNTSQLVAPLILDPKTNQGSFLILYPEPGTWYAAFRLFCGPIDKCPDDCQSRYERCLKACESGCYGSASCKNCFSVCSFNVAKAGDCARCHYTQKCTSEATFNVSLRACSSNCSDHGQCDFALTQDGVLFSTCACRYKYRGWDCLDDSQVTAYGRIVLEFILLVSSNFAFLYTAYVAFRKRYYAEMVVYGAILFFSTFYHACDAGEGVISFCIAKLRLLQFCDFYCALLGSFVTMIAVADLPSYWPGVGHMTGAVLIPFVINIEKQALWTLALPVFLGAAAIFIGWFLKWWKVRGWFLEKRYLYVNFAVGGALVLISVIIYMFLQTETNYQYMHSLWHILLAIAIAVILPTSTTFKQIDEVLQPVIEEE